MLVLAVLGKRPSRKAGLGMHLKLKSTEDTMGLRLVLE